MMHVTYRDQAWTFDRRLTVIQMLKLIRVLPETVLVVRNGQLIAEDQHLFPGDLVKIVSVISGG
ncbi:MAG: MoaD/ThiS family protein [Anaerolineae bacterium]|nr:MoaD/ThiS family protein [Anaerolineae bacterium]